MQASRAVTCQQQANQVPGVIGQPALPAQWYWTILIGDQKVAGAKVSLNGSGEKLVTNSVRIQNLGGFTGMYSLGGDTAAQTSFASDTFTISGKARGFNTSEAERANARQSSRSSRPADASYELRLRLTSLNGTPRSAAYSRGSPRTRSPMMLRAISVVPPPSADACRDK